MTPGVRWPPADVILEPMRLLHIADVHLGSDAVPDANLAEFSVFVQQARHLAADVLLITGDLFENNRVPDGVVEETMRLLGRLAPAVVLPGNHDACGESSVYRRPPCERGRPGVRVIRHPEGEWVRFDGLPARFWGRPVLTHSPAFRPMAAASPGTDPGWRVALAHGHYIDDRSEETPTLDGSPIYRSDVEGVAWDYVALGHWPVPTVVCRRPLACYAGALIDERARRYRCTLVTLSEGEPARLEQLCLPWAGVL